MIQVKSRTSQNRSPPGGHVWSPVEDDFGHGQNFGCPSGQNSIFPLSIGERDDGMITLCIHQYILADERVTEEIKRQPVDKSFRPTPTQSPHERVLGMLFVPTARVFPDKVYCTNRNEE